MKHVLMQMQDRFAVIYETPSITTTVGYIQPECSVQFCTQEQQQKEAKEKKQYDLQQQQQQPYLQQ